MTLFLSTSIVALTFPMLKDAIGSGLTFWVYALITFPVIGFAWKIMPETKQKSLEELSDEVS